MDQIHLKPPVRNPSASSRLLIIASRDTYLSISIRRSFIDTYLSSIDTYLSSIDPISIDRSCIDIQQCYTAYCFDHRQKRCIYRTYHVGGSMKKAMAAKAVSSEWRVNIGETVVDLRVGKLASKLLSSAKSFHIVVLGAFSLFCLKPSGDLCFQKRLGFHPSACCLYTRPTLGGTGS
jgi:hypothetical protein